MAVQCMSASMAVQCMSARMAVQCMNASMAVVNALRTLFMGQE